MRILRTVGAYAIGFGAFLVAGAGSVASWSKFADAKVNEVRPDFAVVIFLVTILVAAVMMWGSWELGRPQQGDYFKA